jgi:hypothetical protein
MGAEEVLIALAPTLIKLGSLIQEAVAAAKEKDAAKIVAALSMADAGIDAALKAMRGALAETDAKIDAELAQPVPATNEPKP